MSSYHFNHGCLVPILLAATSVWAQTADADQQKRAEMQRALNAQVMAAPFDAGDVGKANAYAEEAKKQNVVPVPSPPAYWVPGWSCANLTAYAYYVYNDYRNCVYYHYYYGRYWR